MLPYSSRTPLGVPADAGKGMPMRDMLKTLSHDLKSNHGGPRWNIHDAATLILTTILLVLFFYYARAGFLRGDKLEALSGLLGISPQNPYFRLLPYAYSAVMSVLIRVLIPCLFIWFILKDSVQHFGYRVRGKTGHFHIYAFLFFIMIPILYLVSLTEGFQQKYPMYPMAIQGWDHFLLYQLCYGTQFFALEAFFRGFLLFALFKRFGYYSILIMVMPYCMIHFGKPILETLGAIVAGSVLGYLALKSKSWLYGALLHWAVGILMDLFAILQRGGFRH